VLSAGTLASRILGFVRDVILARLFGTTFVQDAFVVAFKIPNLFRDFVGEGATNAALVPVFSEYRAQKSREDFFAFLNVILALGLIVLSVLAVLGIAAAPGIIRLMAPGFTGDPEKLALTIRLTRIMFPYIIFIGLTAYVTGILFTFRSFAAPAFAPALLNIALIAAYFAVRHRPDPVYGFAVAVLAGGALQLAFLLPSLAKTGYRFRWPRSLGHPGAGKVVRLLGPRLVGGGVYQLTVLVDTFCASLTAWVGPGGISAIYFANRIIYLPMGLFGVSMASAILPSFSEFAQRGDMAAFRKMLVFSLENIFFIMAPMIVSLLVFSDPVIRVIFQRGEFGAYSTGITSRALLFYALGLFSFGGIKIMIAAFHSLWDTRTPVVTAAFTLALNAALNFALMTPLKVGGIALASSIAGTVNFLVLFSLLNKRLGGLNSGLRIFLFKTSLAAALAGCFQYWAWTRIDLPWEVVKLFAAGGAGLAVYLVLCCFLKVGPARKIWAWASKRK
jgi:putative peptidoglycan lipid II flippase